MLLTCTETGVEFGDTADTRAPAVGSDAARDTEDLSCDDTPPGGESTDFCRCVISTAFRMISLCACISRRSMSEDLG